MRFGIKVPGKSRHAKMRAELSREGSGTDMLVELPSCSPRILGEKDI